MNRRRESLKGLIQNAVATGICEYLDHPEDADTKKIASVSLEVSERMAQTITFLENTEEYIEEN